MGTCLSRRRMFHVKPPHETLLLLVLDTAIRPERRPPCVPSFTDVRFPKARPRARVKMRYSYFVPGAPRTVSRETGRERVLHRARPPSRTSPAAGDHAQHSPTQRAAPPRPERSRHPAWRPTYENPDAIRAGGGSRQGGAPLSTHGCFTWNTPLDSTAPDGSGTTGRSHGRRAWSPAGLPRRGLRRVPRTTGTS